jgi:hypothetical protein
MKRYKKYFRNWYVIFFVGIIVFTIALRFYDFQHRWGLAYDQAHDALLAHYAVTEHRLPLLGPFSSAGPFQTGGEWYWIVMIGTAIAPYFLITPWLFIASLYVLFVYCLILVAKEIGGKGYAVLTGLFASLSTAQIAQGTHLTNQSPMALISLLSIWCAVLYVKRQKVIYLFLLGFCVGIASSIHLSGGALLTLIVSLLLLYKKIHYKTVGIVFIGVCIPWIPVLIADFQNHFMNTSNMIYYALHGKDAIPLEALGRRWLTYLGVFWPQQWAFIIGGSPIIGYIIFVSFLSFIFFRRMIKREMLMLLLSIISMIILLRYTHTPLFESYLVFMHPFILLVTAWVAFILFKKNNLLGLVFILIILGGTIYKDYLAFKGFENSSTYLPEKSVTALKGKYKNKKFAVYTKNENWKDKNYLLSFYLTKENLLDKNGLKISIVMNTETNQYGDDVIWGTSGGYQLVSITGSSSSQLKKLGWGTVTGEAIYKDTEEWFNKK